MTATKLTIAAVVTLALLATGPNVAIAHEVSVAVVVAVAVGNSGPDADAVVDGLRLAIDESPDVGHAPGPDAGDHLGGVDVEVIDLGQRSSDDASRAVLEAVSGGATFFVVVGEADAVAPVARDVPDVSAISITVLVGGDDSGSIDDPEGIPGAVLTFTPSFDADTDETLSEAFERAYARSLSASAAAGYDVGQFLDVLLAETDGELPDPAALDRASANAQPRMSFTTLTTTDGEVTAVESAARMSGDGGGLSIPSVVLAGLGAAAVGAVAVTLGRRGRTPPR